MQRDRAVARAALRVVGIPMIHASKFKLFVQYVAEDFFLRVCYRWRSLISVDVHIVDVHIDLLMYT